MDQSLLEDNVMTSSRRKAPSASALTPSQLERKRANDREAQRAMRAKTKAHIARLEREVHQLRELQSSNDRNVPSAEAFQQLLARNQALENELARLREHMRLGLSTSTLPVYVDAGASVEHQSAYRATPDMSLTGFDERLNSLSGPSNNGNNSNNANDTGSDPSVWSLHDDNESNNNNDNNTGDSIIGLGGGQTQRHYHQSQTLVEWGLPMATHAQTPRSAPPMSGDANNSRDPAYVAVPIPGYSFPSGQGINTSEGVRGSLTSQTVRAGFLPSEPVPGLGEADGASTYEDFPTNGFRVDSGLSIHTAESHFTEREQQRRQQRVRRRRGP